MNREPGFWTVDFETEAIAGAVSWRPPKPVSVAVLFPNGASDFISWGHPDSVPERRQLAQELLAKVWASKLPVAFHNAPFDMAVAQAHFNLPWLPPKRVHDSLVLAYLYDPFAPSLSLKPLAQELLHLPPEEQDAVRQWLIEQKIVTRTQLGWGAHICKVPATIVGPYAIGDVVRTKALVDKLLPLIDDRKMMPAYRRELNLQSILHAMTKRGVRIDRNRLCADYALIAHRLDELDTAIRKWLKAPELNLDAGEDLADALEKAGKVAQWGITPGGKRKTARDALIQNLNDPALAHLLAYRGQLSTLCSTFMGPWVEQSETDGRLHPEWNPVRGAAGSGQGGTRTGRLSSSNPNFQNIPTEFPLQPPAGWPELPNMRGYILPEEGEVFVSADFNSQEIRILGHFAEGEIMRMYEADPDADVHAVVQDMVKRRLGIELSRKNVKIIIFSLIYGAGAASIAGRLGCPIPEAQAFITAILDTLTGVRDIRSELQVRGDNGKYVVTWGGRHLIAPHDEHGRRKGYALLNYLIQGTAADQTKQAMIAYDENLPAGKLLASVHDELCVSMPKKGIKHECELLTGAMTEGKFDVPFRVTVKTGPTWGDVK